MTKILMTAIVLVVGVANLSIAEQTPFQRLFDPTTTLTIILEMPQATWSQIANEQPVGGPCNFSQSPSVNRYSWHQTNATLITKGAANTLQSYPQIGIKKKAFCGSLDNTKPSLTLDLTKYINTNQTAADNQLGTTHLSLENSKQDLDLFRQCAGYYVFRTMNIPVPMCSFVELYRRDGTTPPDFLGIYVLTEKVKEDFFVRRPAIQNAINGSLYEFEYPDDFTPATISQLQVEWSATHNQDFVFAVNEVQNQPATALQRILDLPSFISFWATEIFLKSWDGYTSNTNNTYVFDGPPANPQQITKTQFRFIPHGIDQILDIGTKPSIGKKAVVAQLAYQDNGLRYQLIRTLVTMGDQIQNANVPAHIDSFVPLVLRNWRGQDYFFGNDRNLTMQKAENVRLATQHAILDLKTVFGHGLVTPQAGQAFRLFGPYHVECVTRPPSTASSEVSRAACTSGPNQEWSFDAAPLSMTNVGFSEPLALYQVRNPGSTNCLTQGAQFLDGSSRYKLDIAPCDTTSNSQRFLLVQREGQSFELRAFTQDGCAHFSDSVVTSDNRPAVYLGPCDGESKNLIITEPTPSDWMVNPKDICQLHPALCPVVVPRDICKRYPELCETQIVLPGKKGPIVEFRNPSDRAILHLNRICQYVVNCPGCARVGYCPAFSADLVNMPDAFRIEVYDSDGKRVFADLTGSRHKKVRFKQESNKAYFMIVRPGANTHTGKRYELEIAFPAL